MVREMDNSILLIFRGKEAFDSFMNKYSERFNKEKINCIKHEEKELNIHLFSFNTATDMLNLFYEEKDRIIKVSPKVNPRYYMFGCTNCYFYE